MASCYNCDAVSFFERPNTTLVAFRSFVFGGRQVPRRTWSPLHRRPFAYCGTMTSPPVDRWLFVREPLSDAVCNVVAAARPIPAFAQERERLSSPTGQSSHSFSQLSTATLTICSKIAAMTALNIDVEIDNVVRIVLVGLLIEFAKGQDPQFSFNAAQRSDYVLGRYFVDMDKTRELTVEVRKRALAQINDPAKFISESATKPRTLRRRFLNWLERG
jgi:hypothetical protein